MTWTHSYRLRSASRREVISAPALTALLGCLIDPGNSPAASTAGLCHGFSGLLHTTWRMAADAHTPQIAAHLPQLLFTRFTLDV